MCRPIQVIASPFSGIGTLHILKQKWHFAEGELREIMLTQDIQGMLISIPILLLPGARQDTSMIPELCPIQFWERKGGMFIEVPECAISNPWIWPIETNLAAETVIAIAQQRHLDSLNGTGK